MWVPQAVSTVSGRIYCHRFLRGRKEVKEKWVKWKKKKTPNPNPYERRDPEATASASGPRAASAGAAGACASRRCDVGPPTQAHTSRDAGQPGDSEADSGTLRLSAAIPARETDKETRMRPRKQGALLEPEAGCRLWPFVLQNLGSAPADANRRLRSTQCSIRL